MGRMGGIARVTIIGAMTAIALSAAAPAQAQDIYSLQARLMQLEAKVREITTFKPVEPTTVGGAEVLRQRIQNLELTVAEMQNALKHLDAQVAALKKASGR